MDTLEQLRAITVRIENLYKSNKSMNNRILALSERILSNIKRAREGYNTVGIYSDLSELIDEMKRIRKSRPFLAPEDDIKELEEIRRRLENSRPKRSIAVIHHELSAYELDELKSGIKRFNDLMKAEGLAIRCEILCALSELDSIIPSAEHNEMHRKLMELRNNSGRYRLQTENNAFDEQTLTNFIYPWITYKCVLLGFSDALLAVNRKIFRKNIKEDQEHVRRRGGEAYGGGGGGSDGGHAHVTLEPLRGIREDNNREKYVDYAIRHELGHVIGGFRDILPDQEDNAGDDIMRAPPWATDEHLRNKIVAYNKKQIQELNDNLIKTNIETIYHKVTKMLESRIKK